MLSRSRTAHPDHLKIPPQDSPDKTRLVLTRAGQARVRSAQSPACSVAASPPLSSLAPELSRFSLTRQPSSTRQAAS